MQRNSESTSIHWCVFIQCFDLQCFDTVGWPAGRASGLYKTEWWGAGVVICLERDADLHTTQPMPLPLTVSCFSKIQIGFTFLVLAHPGSPGQRAIKRVSYINVHRHIDEFRKYDPEQRPSKIAIKSIHTLSAEGSYLRQWDTHFWELNNCLTGSTALPTCTTHTHRGRKMQVRCSGWSMHCW